MGKPQVDIQVDDATGRWSVDALPMILVPQHFYLNNHYAVEAALGAEKLEQVPGMIDRLYKRLGD